MSEDGPSGGSVSDAGGHGPRQLGGEAISYLAAFLVACMAPIVIGRIRPDAPPEGMIPESIFASVVFGVVTLPAHLVARAIGARLSLALSPALAHRAGMLAGVAVAVTPTLVFDRLPSAVTGAVGLESGVGLLLWLWCATLIITGCADWFLSRIMR